MSLILSLQSDNSQEKITLEYYKKRNSNNLKTGKEVKRETLEPHIRHVTCRPKQAERNEAKRGVGFLGFCGPKANSEKQLQPQTGTASML